jgi:hypothetical protein
MPSCVNPPPYKQLPRPWADVVLYLVTLLRQTSCIMTGGFVVFLFPIQ